MPVSVQCPECGVRLNAPDAAAGQTAECPKCHAPVRVPAPGVVEIEVDEDDARPRRKRPADDVDDRPRRAGSKSAKQGSSVVVNVVVFAAVLLLGGGGFAAYWFAFGDKEKPTRPAPPVELIPTNWSQIGDVKLRVKRALLRAPVTVGPDGADERIAPMELSIWVEVANTSADKKMLHRPWIGEMPNGDTRLDVEAVDDLGNQYGLVSDPGRDVKDNDPAASDDMNPGDPPILFCYRFERPDRKAKELRLSVRSPVRNPPPGRHEFLIPAEEWKR
ncbi:hypothetical protein [Urbifossiella limnaea]|uniref:Uncharacterized protein n=1 Tax=Urbifossiella limnaea TaxID=2528023 RepID=A0A517XWR5_9BACT|nr:hypothetical protein [Urbifossiella limnaea]QDU21947.1 hypothetical protein ETAA1_39210 [Urbifossiella limnaea]